MTRVTWKNLDAERRERIMHAAMEEFGQHGYSGGSLNVVANEAGVAKGSLFQYFDDKLEFFTHVTEQVATDVYSSMRPHLVPPPAGTSFCQHFAGLVDVWIDYMARHPLQRGITAAATLEIDPQVRRAIRQPVHRIYAEGLRPVLEGAAASGSLRRDADIDALLSLLVLLLPHLALAPFEPGLDAAVRLHGTTGRVRSERALRLVSTLFAGVVTQENAVSDACGATSGMARAGAERSEGSA